MTSLNSDLRSPVRTGVYLLVFGFLGFLVWAALAPLDQGVPAPGILSVESKRKTVSHLAGGMVKAIHVKEAQYVTEGERLVSLDDTIQRANTVSAKTQLFALLATEARLVAEESELKDVVFPELLMQSSDPLAVQQVRLNRGLFRARRDSLRADIRVLQEAATSEELLAESLAQQARLLKQELDSLRPLAAEEYVPRNQILQMERQSIELGGAILRAKRSAIEARARVQQRLSAFNTAVRDELAVIRKEIGVSEQRLVALNEELGRMEVHAPVSGYVTDLAIHTVGGVIAPGSRLMEIVPDNEELIFDARIPSHLIDKVSPGLEANIQLHNFSDAPQIVLKGKVRTVSADLLGEKTQNSEPYFLARIAVTPEGLAALGKRKLLPGMQAEVIVLTGNRSLLSYLFKPLLRRMQSAMKED